MKYIKLFEESRNSIVDLTKDQIDEIFYDRFKIESIHYFKNVAVGNYIKYNKTVITSNDQLKKLILATNNFDNYILSAGNEKEEDVFINVYLSKLTNKTPFTLKFHLTTKESFEKEELKDLVINSLGKKYEGTNPIIYWDDFAHVMKCNINWNTRDATDKRTIGRKFINLFK